MAELGLPPEEFIKTLRPRKEMVVRRQALRAPKKKVQRVKREMEGTGYNDPIFKDFVDPEGGGPSAGMGYNDPIVRQFRGPNMTPVVAPPTQESEFSLLQALQYSVIFAIIIGLLGSIQQHEVLQLGQ